MSAATRSDTLAAALPREMVRVARLSVEYRQVGMGFIAATLMDAAIERAQQAIEDVDLAAMIRAFRELQGFER